MANIIHLSKSDFNNTTIGNKKQLCINIQGICLLYYYSKGNDACRQFDASYLNVAQMESRIKFAAVDLSQYPQIVQASKDTDTPIQMPPVLYCYINGKPFAKLQANRDPKAFKASIDKLLVQIQQQQTPQQQQMQVPQQQMMQVPQQQMIQRQQRPQRQQPQQPPVQKKLQYYKIDCEALPSMSVVKGWGQSQYTPSVGYDDEEILEIPPDCIPKNKPWEAVKVDEEY